MLPLRLFRMAAATASGAVAGVVRTIASRGTGRPSVRQLSSGELAPDFSLEGSDGCTYRLRDLIGHAVVIAWFPKAFTGG